jgi:hypothetical protein
MKIAGMLAVVIGTIILIMLLAFGSETLNLKWKAHFAPKHAAVEREVFKQTQSFNEAKLQELVKYRREYMMEDNPIKKAALASVIRHTFAAYDTSKLDYELQSFVDNLKYN